MRPRRAPPTALGQGAVVRARLDGGGCAVRTVRQLAMAATAAHLSPRRLASCRRLDVHAQWERPPASPRPSGARADRHALALLAERAGWLPDRRDPRRRAPVPSGSCHLPFLMRHHRTPRQFHVEPHPNAAAARGRRARVHAILCVPRPPLHRAPVKGRVAPANGQAHPPHPRLLGPCPISSVARTTLPLHAAHPMRSRPGRLRIFELSDRRERRQHAHRVPPPAYPPQPPLVPAPQHPPPPPSPPPGIILPL
jgi:hypothetical protein